MKNTIIIVLVILVIGLGVYAVSSKKVVAPATEQTQQSNQIKTAKSHCGLTINSPLQGSTVTFPLSINTIVDNTQSSDLGCSWTVFEAQAGTVVIKDTSGNTLAQSTLNTTTNWMTTSPTVYTSTINSLSNPNYTGLLTILFTEENPSDNPNPDTLSISVTK